MKRFIYAISVLCSFGLLWGIAALGQVAAPPPQPPAVPAQVAPATPGQQAQTPDQVTFRTQVTDVIVPVTVTDDRGKFVSNLTKDDFRVLDEGRPQRIEFFSHQEKQPIVVGFLVDLSSASRIQWDNFKEATKELIWELLPGDPRYSGYLITYSNDAELAVNTTTNGEALTEKIDKMKPGGPSALFNAIHMACTNRELVKGEPYEPRRVIVIIGDGHDNASNKTLDQVLEIAKRNMVTIYGMSTVSYGFDNASQSILEKLATETGGRVEYPLNTLYKDVSGYISTPMEAGNYVYEAATGGYAAEVAKGIISAVGSLQGEVTTQYVLRYKPDIDPRTASKQFREIKVELPQYPSAKIRARDGYYPFAPPPEAPRPAPQIVR